MMKSKLRLSQVRVATPCTASWDDMDGNEQCRFCALCEKNVYNLSAMTEEAAIRLIEEKDQALCVGFFRRADGTILTQDCPVGLRRKARACAMRLTAGVAAVLALLLAPISCTKRADDGWTDDRTYDLDDVADPGPRTKVESKPASSEETEPRPEEMMMTLGDICIDYDDSRSETTGTR